METDAEVMALVHRCADLEMENREMRELLDSILRTHYTESHSFGGRAWKGYISTATKDRITELLYPPTLPCLHAPSL